MKFRFYITSLFSGSIEGTDDIQAANDCAGCEDFFVVDSEAGMWITCGGHVEIQDINKE